MSIPEIIHNVSALSGLIFLTFAILITKKQLKVYASTK